jgi:GNAT superfamily N-acetyltransferase
MAVIRTATAADRWRIIRLLEESHQAAGYTFAFEAARADHVLRLHLDQPHACALVLDVEGAAQGVLLAGAYDHPFGAGKWAKETVWYITPAHRGRGGLQMLDAYEAWARGQGCGAVGMAALVTNDVSRIYERRGYSAAETHFVKPLG